MNRRMTLALGAALLLSACASVPDPAASRSPDPVLQQIAATASGDFATALDESGSALLLTVAAEPLIGSNEPLILNLTQQQAGSAPRRFVLQISSDSRSVSRLAGLLAPLSPNGQIIAQCPLQIATGPQGISATTDAQSCRFGEGSEQLGLVKEFLFAGDQIRIADRLIASEESARAPLSEQTLRFYRLQRYSGWSGILESGSWRIAQDLMIDSANGRIEPLDAAGMGLGIIIELDRTELESDSQSILRLTVKDAETMETLARSWSAPGTRRLGIALPDLQIGLERVID